MAGMALQSRFVALFWQTRSEGRVRVRAARQKIDRAPEAQAEAVVAEAGDGNGEDEARHMVR